MTPEEKKQQKKLWKQDRIRERHEEWEKIRKLGYKARLQYFWDYYKILLVFAVVAIFIVYIAVFMIQGARTKTLLYACFLNTEELDPDTESLQADYIRALGGIGNTEQIVFDSSIWVNPDATGTSQQDVAASIKIASYVGAGALDVFVAPSHVTEFEQEGGILRTLDDIPTQDEIRTLGEAGCLYYDTEPLTGKTAREMETEKGQSGLQPDASAPGAQTQEYSLNTQPSDGMHIYAVRIDQAGVIGNYDIYGKDRQVWFSVIGNSGRTQEAARFLHFLLGEEIGQKREEKS